MTNEYFELDPVYLCLEDFDNKGLILDIGGGGEGVIGRLQGKDVIAIDIRKDELDEAPEGPQKLVMDAKSLAFQNNSFSVITAFFFLMYIVKADDLICVFDEMGRVVKPGGQLFIWDVELTGEYPIIDKPSFIVYLQLQIKGKSWGTGYGTRCPEEKRDEFYYSNLANNAGFQLINSERNQHIFQLEFQKIN